MPRVAGYFGECIIDFGDRPFMIGDEESFLQRIHQGGAELVAVGQIFGAGPLFFVTLCAIEKSAGRNVERGKAISRAIQELPADFRELIALRERSLSASKRFIPWVDLLDG